MITLLIVLILILLFGGGGLFFNNGSYRVPGLSIGGILIIILGVLFFTGNVRL